MAIAALNLLLHAPSSSKASDKMKISLSRHSVRESLGGDSCRLIEGDSIEELVEKLEEKLAVSAADGQGEPGDEEQGGERGEDKKEVCRLTHTHSLSLSLSLSLFTSRCVCLRAQALQDNNGNSTEMLSIPMGNKPRRPGRGGSRIIRKQ